MSSDEALVRLVDDEGNVHRLTREMVVLAVESQAPLPAELAGGIAIQGELYEPLALVEAAAGIRPGSISRSSALAALRELELVRTIVRFPEPVESTPAPPSLRSQLARHTGEWVAIRDGMFLAAKVDLRELIEQVKGDATIQFVPRHGPS